MEWWSFSRHDSPSEYGCPKGEEQDHLPETPDSCLLGLCRRRPPVLGDICPQTDDPNWRTSGESPKVMACDWCGESADARK